MNFSLKNYPNLDGKTLTHFQLRCDPEIKECEAIQGKFYDLTLSNSFVVFENVPQDKSDLYNELWVSENGTDYYKAVFDNSRLPKRKEAPVYC